MATHLFYSDAAGTGNFFSNDGNFCIFVRISRIVYGGIPWCRQYCFVEIIKVYKMNRFFAVLFLIFYSCIAFAQETTNDLPPSFRVPGIEPVRDSRSLARPDLDELRVMDSLDARYGHPYRIGQNVSAGYTLENSGSWTELPDQSGSLWRLSITIPEARGLMLYFDEWYLPDGCVLYLYGADKSQVSGGFTSAFNPASGLFASEIINGDQLTLELYRPAGHPGGERIKIGEVSYIYRGMGASTGSPDETRASGTCEVDVNCSEGANWQDEKRGVCRMVIKNGTSSFLCTGSLMNNTAQDCTPYVLLADHCSYYSSYATAANMLQWVFYFHYEAASCGGSYSSGQKTKVGCTLLAHDTYGSTETGSDFYLVQLTQNINTSDNIYYNGWSRSTTASASGVGIHHPDGDIKKISTYTSTLTSAGTTHWTVYWAATTNGHGVTEGGSSGSPLFNPSGLVVGTLTGGSSTCTSLTSPDYYGKMSYHWTNNGSTADKQLKPWLDKANTNATFVTGSYTCSPSSVAEIKNLESGIFVYPNPVADILHLALGRDELKNARVYFHDRFGKRVLEQFFPGRITGELLLDVSGLTDGLYFLTIDDDQYRLNKKVMVVH